MENAINNKNKPHCIYRHYKNKLYKYHGVVKHSESLEDMVFYEALYENPLGRFWVRPKEMFFESLSIDGILAPRFKEESFVWTSKTEITEIELNGIESIILNTFDQRCSDLMHSNLENIKKLHLATASYNNKIVGFKLGYEKSKNVFYSWLGSVIPEYQRMGIASQLMTLQHNWCRQEGYKTVQTKTKNKFQNMLLLNIKSGFNIIGTELSSTNEIKIILEKNL